jgi:hypothetical protein
MGNKNNAKTLNMKSIMNEAAGGEKFDGSRASIRRLRHQDNKAIAQELTHEFRKNRERMQCVNFNHQKPL